MVSKIVNNYIVDEYIRLLKDKDKNLKQKDDKIDELMLIMKKADERIQEMQKMQKETRKINKKLVDKLDDANIKLDETKEQLTETNEQLSETNYKLTHVSKKLNIAIEDRVPKTNNIEKLEDFILLKNRRKNPDFKYYAVRGQTSYVNRKANKKISEEKYKEILRINSVANSVNLWNRLKEQLKKSVEYCGNEMNLISISEQQLIDIIKDIYEKRKLIYIENVPDEISDDE
jgi:DNA repair exonuclease SbcCD ATPase subunit